MHQNHLEDLLEHGLPGPTFKVSDSIGLGQKLRICISNESPTAAIGVVLRITLGELLL